MRPLYETQEDLFREEKVVEILKEKWGCNFYKMPKTSSVDYFTTREEKVVGFVEIKNRTNPMTKYNTYMISKKKVDAAKCLHEVLGLSTVLVVNWSDWIGYVFLNKSYPERQGGRYDRKDPADIETVVDIDISCFKLL